MNTRSSYETLGKRLLIILGAYSLCRILYLLFNIELIHQQGVWTTFLIGIRFDLSAILYINALFIFISVIPFSFINKTGFQKGLRYWYIITNGLAILLNIVDFEYVKFTGKRTDSSVLQIIGDIINQSGSLLKYFWYLPLIWIGILLVMWKLYPLTHHPEKKLNKFVSGLLIISTVLATFVGMRGGLQLKPITPINAFEFEHSNELANLSLNTPFNMMQTAYKQSLKRMNWFSETELQRYLSMPVSGSFQKQKPIESPNIVLIIMESFAAEYVGHLNDGKGHTPFLDSLAHEGIFFENHFANGRTSSQAISSILAGIPCLLEGTIANSRYQSNRFHSIFESLNNSGYKSCFFNGGENGTMSFDLFTSKLGLDYFGMNEYPNPNDFDGQWGIYDEPYLQYCVNVLDTFNAPFAAVIFTLSSHHPYKIPNSYKEIKPTQGKPIHQSVEYADASIREFFNSAKQKKWFKNTLFVLTSDHTSINYEKEYQNFLGHYRTPLVFYHPSEELIANTEKVTQQVDIPISIGDFLGMELRAFPRFGKSVFQPVSADEASFSFGHCILYDNNSYYLVNENRYIKMKGLNDTRLYNAKNDVEELIDSTLVSGVNQLKARIQYFNNNMIDNSFVKLKRDFE